MAIEDFDRELGLILCDAGVISELIVGWMAILDSDTYPKDCLCTSRGLVFPIESKYAYPRSFSGRLFIKYGLDSDQSYLTPRLYIEFSLLDHVARPSFADDGYAWDIIASHLTLSLGTYPFRYYLNIETTNTYFVTARIRLRVDPPQALVAANLNCYYFNHDMFLHSSPSTSPSSLSITSQHRARRRFNAFNDWILERQRELSILEGLEFRIGAPGR